MTKVPFSSSKIIRTTLIAIMLLSVASTQPINKLKRHMRSPHPNLDPIRRCLDVMKDCLDVIKDDLALLLNCAPIPVVQSDSVGGDFGIITLDTKGNYQLGEDIKAQIVITASDICLDLCCFKVSHNDSDAAVIAVDPDLTRIRIFNGNVCNTDLPPGTGSGILVNLGAENVQIEKVKIFDCNNGIKLDGDDGSEVIECEIIACDLIRNTIGVLLDHADENIIKDCRAARSTQAGFAVVNGASNCFYDCQTLKTQGNDTVVGFKTENGCSNLFQRCTVKKTKTTAREFCKNAYGFLLTGTEKTTKIIDCVVNETVVSTPSVLACGISLDGVLLPLEDLLETLTVSDHGNTVRSVAWSPNSKFLAVGGSLVSGTPDVTHSVYGFDGTILTLVESDNHGGRVRSVDWSPNGKFLAIGGTEVFDVEITTTITHRVYRFDGTTLVFCDFSVHGSTLSDRVNSVAWSPDGKFLAVGGNLTTSPAPELDLGTLGTLGTHRVYSFDGTRLEEVASENNGQPVLSVSWSPDGKFLAIGGDPTTNTSHRVYSFNGTALTLVASAEHGDDVKAVAWSPNGKFLAIGGLQAADNKTHRIYCFDGTALTEIASADNGLGPSTQVNSVDWSPNGKFLATGGDDSAADGNTHRVYSFSESGLTLVSPSADHDATVRSVSWSSGGKFLAIGGSQTQAPFITHRVHAVMNAPMNCLIKENCICDTAANGQLAGTGFMGGGMNTFVSNVSCNNEVSFSYGIPNVFFGDHNRANNQSTRSPFENVAMPADTIPN